MSNDFPRKRKFTALIDLTTRGQEVAKAEVAQRELAAAATPDPDAAPAIEASFSLAETPEIVQKAAANAGWDRLMPVQEKTIPVMLSGRDVIVQSKTGSGKTGAFLLPLFSSLDSSEAAPQALVLTPTRELARQIYEEFIRVGGPSLGFRAALVYGGVAYGPQQDALRGTSKEGAAQVVIGTPGRILDHLERRTFTLDRLKTLVLDEADEMLSMGFLPAMRKLHRYLSGKRQSAMFSATMPPTVRALAQQFLDAPQFLALAGGTVQIDALSHRFYEVDGMEKDRALIRIIEMENPESAIIFANTKREVEYLAQFLRNYGHDAGEISGDLNQNAREAMMARIRAGNLRFLIATDVAARGIDISDLSHVVQYDVPIDPEYYVHRAGRTARAGKTGVAITFVAPHDKPKLLSIFRRYDLTFEQRTLPTEEEVAERVRERLTVLLEERYRETKNLTRERIARFEPLARALAEEEPHLLAFLLDEAYHESLHRAPQAEVIETSTHRGLAPLPREERSRDRGRKGRREHDDLYEAGASDDAPASAEAAPSAAPAAPAPIARPRTPEAEAPAPAPAPEATEEDRPAAEEGGEGGRRRKKRRRKKRRGDAPTSEGASHTSDDDEGDDDEAEVANETPAPAPADEAPRDEAPAPDSRPERRERGGRGGRGRGRQSGPSDESPRDEAPVTSAPRPSDAPAPARPAEAARPSAEPSSAAKTPEVSAARRAAVPPGPYRIQGLRAMPEATLRAVGESMEIGESGSVQRDDLVYRILEVQADRESTGRGRRPGTRPSKPAAPARSQAPAKPAPAPRPAAPAPPAEPDAAAAPEAKPARPSRGRGRASAKPAAPVDEAMPETAAPTVPEPDAPEAPKRARRSTRKAAEPNAPAETPVETPTAEAAPAEKPARRTRKAAEPDAAPAPDAPAADAAKPRRRRKADAPPLEPVVPATADAAPAPDASKPRARRKKADAPEASAPAASDAAPAADAAPAPKPRARRKPKQDDGAVPDAA